MAEERFYLEIAEETYLTIKKLMDDGSAVRDNYFLFRGAVALSQARSLERIAEGMKSK